MDISTLSSTSLRSIAELVEKRETLADELAKLDATILAALGGKVTKERASKPGKRGPKKGPRKPKPQMNKKGALKDFIVAELTAAGEKGVAVKELAERLGVKAGNIHVWFASTGKGVGAKRVGRGRYAL